MKKSTFLNFNIGLIYKSILNIYLIQSLIANGDKFDRLLIFLMTLFFTFNYQISLAI